MKKIFSLLLFLPLLSMIVACQENADVLGFTDGQDPEHAFDNTYLDYFVLDDSPRGYSLDEFQRTALLYTWDQNDLLITEDRFTKQPNMKGYGTGFSFYILDDEYLDIHAGAYYIVNPASLSEFVHNKVYAGYTGEDREALEAAAVDDIAKFLGQKTSNAGQTNVFIDQLFIFGSQALLTKDPQDGYHDIISPLLDIGYTPQDGGKTLIINSYNGSEIIPVYQFIRETAEVITTQQFTQERAQFTAKIEKTVYNY